MGCLTRNYPNEGRHFIACRNSWCGESCGSSGLRRGPEVHAWMWQDQGDIHLVYFSEDDVDHIKSSDQRYSFASPIRVKHGICVARLFAETGVAEKSYSGHG